MDAGRHRKRVATSTRFMEQPPGSLVQRCG
jgi:hypothetical protein